MVARTQPGSPRGELLALLDAVKERPKDDAPRLVLADWLEEHGDADDVAHGQFIRIQCELARLPLSDPRVPALRRREHQLQQAHAAAWLRPFSEALPDWKRSDWKFERGLAHLALADTTFMGPELDKLGGAEAWARVESLYANVAPRGLLKLLAMPGLASLTSLQLHTSNWGGFRPDHYRALLRCPHLRRLRALTITSVDFCEGLLGTKGIAALGRSGLAEQLTSLELFGKSVDAAAAETVAQSPRLAQLKELTLSGDRIGPAGIKALVRSPHLAALEHLSLLHITRAGLQALTSTTGLPRLKSLDITCGELGPAPPYRLATWPHLAGLTTLRIHGCRLGPDGVLALMTSPHATQLNWLDVGHNHLGPEAAVALAGAPGLRSLTHLSLCLNQIGPVGVKALLASPHLARVEELDLSANHLGPEGMAALVAQPLPPSLRRLHLWGNDIGPEGAMILAGWPYLSQLTSLDLHMSGGMGAISVEGAEALAASPYLASLLDLNVGHNAIGLEGKATLEQSPHLRNLISLDTTGWDKD
jgi:uncharacterized protein (TIGR02996 family)